MTAPTDLENHAPETDIDPEAPYGRTLSGRPKRGRGGRPPGTRNTTPATPGDDDAPPSLDELKADGGRSGSSDDTPPGRRRTRVRGRRPGGAGPAPTEPRDPPPAFRAGPIATGVNKLYRRAGKIIRAVDPMLGAAVISTTEKDAPDDTTVGEAWEEVARTNVQVRVFLLKLITGGAWGQVLVCHLPIVLAILMKESVRRHIPFGNLLFSVLEDDGMQSQDPTGYEGAFPPGMGIEVPPGMDIAGLMNMAASMAGQNYARMNTNGTGPRVGSATDQLPGQTSLDDWVTLDQQ